MSLREKIILALGIVGIGTVTAVGINEVDEQKAIVEKKNDEIEAVTEKNGELVVKTKQLEKDITNQNKVIVSKDEEITAKNKKIKEKHERIIHVKNVKNERIEYLKRELKKKPKVVYKTQYKEKIVYKTKPQVQTKPQVKKQVSVVPKAQSKTVVNKQVQAKPVAKKTVEQASNETGDYPTQKRKVVGSSGATFQMTSYTADCNGCSGITATGVNVKNTTTYNGMRVIAVDPRVIPLGSVVRVTTSSGSFTAKALDTGGAIKGNIIDLLVDSRGEAQSNGRQSVKVEILN